MSGHWCSECHGITWGDSPCADDAEHDEDCENEDCEGECIPEDDGPPPSRWQGFILAPRSPNE